MRSRPGVSSVSWLESRPIYVPRMSAEGGRRSVAVQAAQRVAQPMTVSQASGYRAAPDLLRVLHAGAWRATPPPLDVTSTELIAVLPTLFRSASVGLIWPRVRGMVDPSDALGQAMTEGYRRQREANARVIEAIPRVIGPLREAGIQPILVKGWSVSRHYAAPAVRLCGDIDLIVRPGEYDAATAVLHAGSADIGVPVDLQHAPTWRDRGDWDLRVDAETNVLAGVPVLVPSREAHLRLLCLHLLVHGAMRPLWLSDVAVMLETRGADFDWDRCLGADRRRRGWVLTVLRLAHEVLGAEITGTPVAAEPPLPRWLVPALLERWERAAVMPAPVERRVALRPLRLLPAVRERWQDPIRATVTCGLPFNDFPRLPIQCAAFMIRSGQFLRVGD